MAVRHCDLRRSCPLQETLLPFLYSTRTIQRRTFNSSRSTNDINDAAPAPEAPPRNVVRRVQLDNRNNRDRASFRSTRDPHGLRPARKNQYRSPRSGWPEYQPPPELPGGARFSRGGDDSTITQLERDAFAQLFGRLEKKKTAPLSSQGEELDEADVLGEDNYADLDEQLDPVLDRATVERYPTSLQKMAERAEVAVARRRRKDKKQISEMDESLSDVAIAEGRWEARRISALMDEATTDVELWKVLDNEVFSTMRALEAERLRKEEEQAAPPRSIDRPILDDLSQNTTTNNLPADTTPTKPPSNPKSPRIPTSPLPTVTLPVFSHYYPIVTWHALRRLTSRQPASPLVPSLLPTIKSLGRTSLVLAASTPLFNVLLAHAWRTSGSLARVLALLREMDGAGVAMNDKTWTVLGEVARRREAGERGWHGEAVAALEGMSARKGEGIEVMRWRGRIREGMERRVVEAARRREEEERLLVGEMDLEEEEEGDLNEQEVVERKRGAAGV